MRDCGGRKIEVDGVARTVVEWAALTGLRASTIRDRIERGWDPARAVREPPSQARPARAGHTWRRRWGST